MIKHNYDGKKEEKPEPVVEKKEPVKNVVFQGLGAHTLTKANGERVLVYFNPEYGKKYVAKDPEIAEILRKKGYKEVL